MKGVQCNELFGGIALKNHFFFFVSFFVIHAYLHTKDIRQLKTSLDAKKCHWIWKLETLTLHGLNAADTF